MFTTPFPVSYTHLDVYKRQLPEKDKIPLLVNGNGEIIWVVGLRQDNRYKVTATTKKVTIFELSK